MVARGGELVATDEPAVVSKPSLDAIVMEDSQSNGCFPNPPWADESKWSKVLCETNDLFNQFVAPETDSRRRGRQFSRGDTTSK